MPGDQPATAARRNVIEVALRAYKSETEQYLTSYREWPLTNPYDPACCDTCRREHARWETGEVSRKLLVERLDTINDALSEVAVPRYLNALHYIASPTMGLPAGKDALEYADEASETHVRSALKACIRTARAALDG